MDQEITLLHVSLISLVSGNNNLALKSIDNVSNIKLAASLFSELDTLRFLEEKPLPHLLFLEIHTFTSIELNFIKHLKEQHPKLKILCNAFLDDVELLQLAFENKIEGFIIGGFELQELIYAVKQILLGQPYLSSQLGIKYMKQAASIKNKSAHGVARSQLKISKRELEILKFVAAGFTNEEISEKLFSSKRTIEGNRKKLLEKTGTRNTAELIGFAVRNNFID
ncbi:two-component system response regulator NreC [Pedobacter sp. UYP30]|uniref:helix-turn-helix transcriptional regulator n=1 Tax=Pedobacter sp. UYP30 TaxID=1756400 RepID=UPI003394B309